MKKIIFVYNANSGIFSSLKDTIHKTISPKTYKCNLCQITFGAFNMNEDWKKFIQKLPYEIEFLHKDEFIKKYGKTKYDFPNVFTIKNGKPDLLISNKEINSARTIEDLKTLVQQRIKSLEK